MQLSAFAESQSAEGIPEAVTTGSGQLQEQSGKAEEQSAGNGQIQAEEQSAGNGQIQAEERSAGNGQTQAEERSAANGQTQAEEQTAENRQNSRNELFQGRLKQKFIFVTVMKCLQPSIMHLLWENLALQEMTSHISQ